MEFYRTPGEVGTADGGVVHGIGHFGEGKGPEVLVHVHVDVNGFAHIVDYDTHPNVSSDYPPHVLADKAKRFLDSGGAKFLGHTASPASRDAQVAKLKTKHGLD